VIAGLSPASRLSWERDVLPSQAALYGFTCCRWFVDIGTPESLRRAAETIAQHAESAR
jgi:NDP-sugar pyrophosphorylase family protein